MDFSHGAPSTLGHGTSFQKFHAPLEHKKGILFPHFPLSPQAAVPLSSAPQTRNSVGRGGKPRFVGLTAVDACGATPAENRTCPESLINLALEHQGTVAEGCRHARLCRVPARAWLRGRAGGGRQQREPGQGGGNPAWGAGWAAAPWSPAGFTKGTSSQGRGTPGQSPGRDPPLPSRLGSLQPSGHGEGLRQRPPSCSGGIGGLYRHPAAV